MRITHRMIANSANYNLQKSLRSLEHYSNQLSTGKAFQRPSENPVGVGRVMSYTAAVDRNEQYRLNINQSKGWLENTENALRTGLDVLQRVRELAIYGANESLTAEDRRAIAPEVLEFLNHLVGVANTESNGLYVFGGHQTLKAPFVAEKAYHINYDGGGIVQEEGIVLEGLQNGDYSLSQSRETAGSDLNSSLTIGQSFLQGSAESIIGQAGFGAPREIVSEVLTGADLAITEGFASGMPVEDFVLELDYSGGEWHYTDHFGVPNTVDPTDPITPFEHFGVQIDLNMISGAPAEGDIVSVTSSGTVTSSVQLEVTSADPESGRVDYRYSAHQYNLDGEYEKKSGEFSLQFGSEEEKFIKIGSVEIAVNGLGEMAPTAAAGLKVGDRAVLNIAPSQIAGEEYGQVTLAGSHRGGTSGLDYIFSASALASLGDPDFTFNYFSLDTFGRSPERGTVYDGSLTLTYSGFEESPQALAFSYDNLGFPVYYGDNKDRAQEISPHQQMIMNVQGEKAFGENQEIFDSIYAVYWALIDNDREALGDSALSKMDDSVNHFLERLAEVGARSNRVEVMHNTLFSENLYLREVRSNIEDIDLAQVITEFTMQENAYQAALSTSSMMLQPSLVDYLR